MLDVSLNNKSIISNNCEKEEFLNIDQLNQITSLKSNITLTNFECGTNRTESVSLPPKSRATNANKNISKQLPDNDTDSALSTDDVDKDPEFFPNRDSYSSSTSDLFDSSNAEENLKQLKRFPSPDCNKLNDNKLISSAACDSEDVSFNVSVCSSVDVSNNNVVIKSNYPNNKRWKRGNPELWKKNLAKKRRSVCKPYTTLKKERPAKLPKVVDCSSCRFKCEVNFNA